MSLEDELQKQCYQWYWNTYQNTKGILYHVPNGGKRHKGEATKLKWMGVRPGIPDFVFEDHTGGIGIELKTPDKSKSRLTKSQKEIFPIFGDFKKVYLVRTFEDFQELFRRYFKKPTYDQVYEVLDDHFYIKPRKTSELGFYEIETPEGRIFTFPTKALYDYAHVEIKRLFLQDAISIANEILENLFDKTYKPLCEYEWDYKK